MCRPRACHSQRVQQTHGYVAWLYFVQWLSIDRMMCTLYNDGHHALYCMRCSHNTLWTLNKLTQNENIGKYVYLIYFHTCFFFMKICMWVALHVSLTFVLFRQVYKLSKWNKKIIL